MLIVLGILAVIALGGIIYIFLSGNSSKIQKMAALGAIILCGLALGVCGIRIIFGGASGNDDPYAFPLLAEEVQPKTKNNSAELIIFLVVLMVIFGFVIFIGIRDKSKQGKDKKVKNDSDFFDDN